MKYHVVEIYRSKSKSKKQRWFWRFVFQNGKRRQELSRSSEGYSRRIDCLKCWHSTRNALLKVVVL